MLDAARSHCVCKCCSERQLIIKLSSLLHWFTWRYQLSPQLTRPCQTRGRCATARCQPAHAPYRWLSTLPNRSAAAAGWARPGAPAVTAALCQDQVQVKSPCHCCSCMCLNSPPHGLAHPSICKLNRPYLVFTVLAEELSAGLNTFADIKCHM